MRYSKNNLDEFINCFQGVDNLIILPVWEPSKDRRDIDFKKHFSRYNPVFTEKVDSVKEVLDSGLIIGFGAGDITYQLRDAVSL